MQNDMTYYSPAFGRRYLSENQLAGKATQLMQSGLVAVMESGNRGGNEKADGSIKHLFSR
jgi:hypothetical protein